MTARDEQMFNLRFGMFCKLIAETPADDPPGAIAAAAAVLATAAGLTAKCVVDGDHRSLDVLSARALRLAVRDAKAYRAWRNGDIESLAVVVYPQTLADLASDLIEVIDAMPPHPLTGETDLSAARMLAVGAREAAKAVADGNQADAARLADS